MERPLSASPEAHARALFAALDGGDFDRIQQLFADDVQGIDEISRGWLRGRQAAADYFRQLAESVSDIHSELRGIHTVEWTDTALVTLELEQTYRQNGQPQRIQAPTSILLRREGAEWRTALVHSVPLPPP